MILTCALIAIIDGDTLRAQCDGIEERIRLADIDAPERHCPEEWAAAKDYLTDIMPPVFALTWTYRDRYGRIVATIHAPDMVNAQMLASGHARPWPHDSSGRETADKPKGC